MLAAVIVTTIIGAAAHEGIHPVGQFAHGIGERLDLLIGRWLGSGFLGYFRSVLSASGMGGASVMIAADGSSG
jgi:hypothetical protein